LARGGGVEGRCANTPPFELLIGRGNRWKNAFDLRSEGPSYFKERIPPLVDGAGFDARPASGRGG